jgi:hypothetical protein
MRRPANDEKAVKKKEKKKGQKKSKNVLDQ